MAGRRDEDEEGDKRVINRILITGHKQGEIISGRQPTVGSSRIDPFTEGTRDGIGTSLFSDACVILQVHIIQATYFFFSLCVAFPLTACKHRLSEDIYAAN